VLIEAGQVRSYAEVIGDHNPIYRDEQAAKEAGYAGILTPPTFLFCLEMGLKLPTDVNELLKIDIGRVLHGEEKFIYHEHALVGDRVTFHARITDIYDKKGGALEFFVLESIVKNQNDILLAEISQVVAIRN
jgi:acyl dehydratase